MRIFFDSSALAKRYVQEVGTDRVLSYCAAADEVIVSVLLPVEVMSGLNRLRREGRLATAVYGRIKRNLARDLAAASVIGIDEHVVRSAISYLEAGHLRSLDALQIASADLSKCDLFVSADRRQAEAARAAGMPCELIP